MILTFAWLFQAFLRHSVIQIHQLFQSGLGWFLLYHTWKGQLHFSGTLLCYPLKSLTIKLALSQPCIKQTFYPWIESNASTLNWWSNSEQATEASWVCTLGSAMVYTSPWRWAEYDWVGLIVQNKVKRSSSSHAEESFHENKKLLVTYQQVAEVVGPVHGGSPLEEELHPSGSVTIHCPHVTAYLQFMNLSHPNTIIPYRFSAHPFLHSLLRLIHTFWGPLPSSQTIFYKVLDIKSRYCLLDVKISKFKNTLLQDWFFPPSISLDNVHN